MMAMSSAMIVTTTVIGRKMKFAIMLTQTSAIPATHARVSPFGTAKPTNGDEDAERQVQPAPSGEVEERVM